MAQVILAYPSTGLDLEGISVWLPLATLNVAAMTVGDFDTVIVDQRIEKDWAARLRREITDETICIGISSMTGTQIRSGLQIAQVVRELRPNLPIVWGGNHPTLAPETTAIHSCVDIVVLGEGERTFPAIVRCLSDGTDWRQLPNVCWAEKDGQAGVTVKKNGTGMMPQDFINPDEIPELPYHLVDVERYVNGKLLFGRKLRALPFITSNGCPYACTFCCQPVLSSRRWRKQSPELAVERARKLVETYNLEAIEFHDEEFFVNRKRGEKIARLINGDFQWYVQTRMDDLLALDLEEMERCGLAAVQPGLETGSARILEMIKKEETLEDFREANRRLARTGIRANYNFMMGYPTETYADLVATVDLALELLDANPNAHVAGFYVFVPYPGSELFDLAVLEGFQVPQSLESWSQFNRHHMASPWVSDRLEMIEHILISSKLVDGDRLIRAFEGNPPLRWILRKLSSRYRKQWRNRRFKRTLDIRILNHLARSYFNW